MQKSKHDVWVGLFVLLGLAAPLPWVIVSSGAMGVAFTLFGVLWNTTMQREVQARPYPA